MSSRNRWLNRLSKRSAVVLAAASAASSFSSSLWAVTGTYTVNGGSNWATNANWLFGNPYPNAAGEIANFTATDLAPISPLVVPITLNDNITVGSIVFGDTNPASPGGWLLTPSGSSTLTLATGSSAQPVLNIGNLGNNAAVSYTEIAASIYGTTGFNKTGAGLLRLSGDNTGTTALGGNPLGLTGSLTINAGTLEVSSTLNLGNTDSTITLAGGNLSLRSDGTLNLSNRNLVVTANSGLNVDRSITNTSLTNRIHQIGTVTMGSGPRILDIRGSNFYGVNIGTLILGVGNTLAIVNELAPGELTIGTILSSVTSATTLTLGGTNNATTGANITITGAIIQQTATGTLSLTYSDNHTVQIGSLTSVTGGLNITGNGTVIISSGKLPTNTLTVSAGTLDFSASGQASTVANLVMGTTTNNQVGGAYINSGAGTLAVIGTVTHQVAGNANQRLGLGAIIDGNLDLGSLAHSLNIGGIASLTSGGTPDMRVNAVTTGSGALTKIGTGEIFFTAANGLSSALTISAGTYSGAARSAGNALTSGAVTISGGTLRLNNLGATPGSGSIGSLSFDGGATNPARLVVDSGTSGAATTLKIGTFNGRAPGTTGALTIIPRNGGLNTTEIISAGAFGSAVGTGANHGILAPFVAAQQSATNSSVDFLTVSGGNIVGGAAAYVGGNISDAPTNSVYSTTSAQTLGGAKQLFAIKADGTLADIGGGGVLTLGDGTLAGLILNNGAKVTASSLVINGPEAIFWAGGRIIDNDGTTVLAAGGTISSNISFSNPAGGLTTSGAETLTIAGQFNMSGQSRQVLTANGTAVFSGALTNGNFTKAGPGYVLLTNANTGYNGTLLSSSGTLQVGQGSLTPTAGIGATSVVNVGNGNVVLALDGPKNLGNFITSTGTGNLIVDSPTGVINFTNATSNFARLTIQSGNVQLTGDNQLPQGATLTVQGSGSLDMNGRSQTVAALAGATGGTITNNGAGLSTLTVNIGSGSSTYNSVITNGTGIAVNKNGAGTQIFTGASNYAGGTKLNLGTLQLQNNTAAGVGSIQFVNNGGALAMTGVTIANTLSVGNVSATLALINNGSSGTLNGPIVVGNTGTLNVVWGGTGQTLNVPNLSSANFTGTLAFAGNGGTFRIVSGATAGSAYNLSAATFNFGSSTTTFGFNQGSVTVTMPFISGGTNATIGAGANGRINRYILGTQTGNQTFNGVVVDGGSPTSLVKRGAGTFTLSSSGIRNHSFTGELVVESGTFVIGNNAVLTGAGNLRMQGGNIAIAANGTMSGNKVVLLSEQNLFDVTQVPGGWSTPPSVTLSETGFVNGAYIHGAGTIAPGGFTTPGTITFNTLANPSNLTLNGGVLNLDIKAAGASNVGGGTNDLIVVNGDVNFTPSAQIRVNYVGAGSLVVGQDYPIIFYTGSRTGFAGGVGAVSTTSGTVSSPFRSAFSLKDLGGGVIAAHVDASGGSAQSMRWVGTQSGAWDLNFTKNFQVAGVGTTFFQNDTVVFDNLGSLRPAITISDAIYLPAAVIFSNGSNVVNYTLSGNGTIAGSTGLLVNGTGQVTITNQNTFTGNTTISSGQVSTSNVNGSRFGTVVANSPLGAGTVYLGNADGSSTLQFGANNSAGVNFVNDVVVAAGKIGAINVGNGTSFFSGALHGAGTIILSGASTLLTVNGDLRDFTGTINVISSSANVRVGNSFAAGGNAIWNFVSPVTLNNNITNPSLIEIPVGAVIGSGNISGLSGGSVVSGDKTWVIGGSNQNSAWSGGISDAATGNSNGGANAVATVSSIAKTGTGSMLLTGVNISYTGETEVRQGILELSNIGGPGNSPRVDGGKMTGTRAVRVRNGGTFRLGTPGGDVSNSGTITTAATQLLLTVDQGGVIDISNAYDADGVPTNPEDPENSPLAFSSFKTAPGVTWAGNGGTVIGTIRHEAGTISPGRDTGSGAIGTLNFSDTLRMYGGAVTMDVGSTSVSRDFLNAGTLDIAAGTVVVNVIGNSIAANQSYTLMSSPNILLTNPSGFTGLVVNGRGASGTLVTGPNTISLKMLSAATSAQVTWNGASGGTWDAKGGLNWVNHLNTPDYFYQGDTVAFTDQGAGVIRLAYNITPAGTVVVNNSSSTYFFTGPGKITGGASLRKMGTGSLVITTENDYTGGTIIDAGGTILLGQDNRTNDGGLGVGSYSPDQNAIGEHNPLLFGQNKYGALGSGSIVNNGVLVVRKNNATFINQNISGTGSLYNADLGVLVLNGTNTYSGGTTISLGTIKLGHANAIPSAGSVTLLNTTNFLGGNTTNGRGGKIDLNGFAQTIEELNGFGDAGTPGNPIVGDPQDVVISNGDTLGDAIATLTINRTGPQGYNGRLNNGGGAAGQLALVKNTSGVATLNYSGTSNYTGRTTINGGTIILSGTHNPSTPDAGSYIINTGGALAGDGEIAAKVTANAGGIVAPGVPGGTFGTLNIDSLTLASANLNFELQGSTVDELNVVVDNGWLLTGVNAINLNVVGSLNAGTFTLVNYSGANLSSLLTNVALGSITNGTTFNFALNSNVQDSSLELIVTQPIVSATWQTDNNGTWGTAVNWTSNPTTPNAFGSTANFGSISAPRTVNMDGPFSIGTANFTSPSAFTIAGSSITTLTLGNLIIGSGVGINVTAGNHSINVPLVFNNDGTINVSAGATLNLAGGFGLNANGAFSGHNVTKIGTGTLVADNIRNTFGNNGSALLNVTQGTVRMSLKPTAGAAEGTSKVNSLAIAGGGAARLDLTNNSMVLDYAAALGGDGSAILAQLRGWLKSTDGRLYSSAADDTKGLGYKDNSDITGAGNKGVSNFGGVTVDGSAILVKYTYLGDTNVDGQVDISDIYNLASNYNPNHTGSAVSVWQKGDFNYDGWVDLQDLTKLATNWQAGVGNPLGSGLGAGLGPILASLGLPQVAVPEPTTLGLVGIGLTGLMARRRRKA